MMKKIYKTLGSMAVAGIIFAAPVAARAAVVTTGLTVALDTRGQAVNAIDIHLSFDPGVFHITGIGDGGSVVNLWITPPTFSNASGTVDFSGIIPGGITTASGTIVTITVAPAGAVTGAAAEGRFAAVSGTVLLNDGKGTSAPLTFINAPFSLAPQVSSSAATGAAGGGAIDTGPPNLFTPEIAHDPNIFNGQFFLVFSATDEQSGIDHYEVREGAGNWRVASSPYLLQDQTLSGGIGVRAVDRAGNIREVEIPASAARAAAGVPPPPPAQVWAIIIVAGIILITAWIMKRKRRR